jgi:subtilisin family serine protease
MRRPVRPGFARHVTVALAAIALTVGAALPVLTVGAGLPAVPAKQPAHPPAPRYVEGELLVKFRPDAPAPTRGAVRLDVAGTTRRRFASGTELWRLGPGVAVPDAVARLEQTPGIQYAEPNYILHAASTPDDPFFPIQWALQNTGQSGGTAGVDIDATDAWDITEGAPVVVAVVDTGVDMQHPDLAANIWTNPDEIPGNLIDDDGNGLVDDVHGYDFVNHDDDPNDDDGHGTHVAGTIAAIADNGMGVAGVAPHARVMPVKFLDASGLGTTADAIEAIDYATAMGARVINASWGGGDFSDGLLDSIRNAALHEVLFVAAAGNDGADSDHVPFFPAGFDAPNIIAVAATDRRDQLARFSNHGATKVDVAAPGVDIDSTLPGGAYGFSSGTSMATPHVSGVAALILGFAPGMPAEALRGRILDHAEPVASLLGQVATGARLNAFRCLQGAERIAPGPIVDLRVADPLSNGLVVTFTAPGDDAGSGTASAYDLRVSETPFDAASFDDAPRWPLPGPPRPGGTPETREIDGLETSRTYYLGLRAVDEWGNIGPPGFATATTLPAPTLQLSPTESSAALLSGETTTRTLTLRNVGEGTLDWSAQRPIQRPWAARAVPGTDRWGGPDSFGYAFTDSDEPHGPVFAWRDITATGRTAILTGDDVFSDALPIGFAFPFYGKTFTSVRISGNGYLTFNDAEAPFDNLPLPNPGVSGNLVAGYWDDLYVPGLQSVLWLAEPHSFTVQYDGVLRMGGGGPYTFEMILFDTGEILFQYLELAERVDSATVGLQDQAGAAGLQIALDEPYVHDRMAVLLLPQRDWVTAVPASGRLRSGASAAITLSYDALELPGGLHEGWLPIVTNDPARPRVELPLSLSVQDARAIAVAPSSIDFGTVIVGYPWQREVEIVNRGSLPLMVTAAVPDDPAVRTDFAPFTLASGERHVMTLDWLPAVPGGLMADLHLESNASNAPSLRVPIIGSAPNIPPTAAAIWPPSQVECTGPQGADAVLDASLSGDDDSPPGQPLDIVRYEWLENLGTAGESILGTGARLAKTLSIGTHALALRVTDAHGAVSSTGKTITIADTTPPEFNLSATPAVLWPPDHRLVPVRLVWSAHDACSGAVTVRLTGVTSNEPDDAPGARDGRTTGDIAGATLGVADDALQLRAELGAAGPGRIYTIRFVATDAAGHVTTGETAVAVPRKARHR